MNMVRRIAPVLALMLAPLAGCAATTNGVAADPTGPAALDGVYEVTTTAEDVSRAGAPSAAARVEENHGSWVYVVDHGRFVFTQEEGPACTWAYGTWVVKGQQVEWAIVDGGGMAPNNAANRPGEFFVFGWSLYRDNLTLTKTPGQISPENFLAKPWHRVSTTPSTDRLSKRCPPPATALSG